MEKVSDNGAVEQLMGISIKEESPNGETDYNKEIVSIWDDVSLQIDNE